MRISPFIILFIMFEGFWYNNLSQTDTLYYSFVYCGCDVFPIISFNVFILGYFSMKQLFRYLYDHINSKDIDININNSDVDVAAPLIISDVNAINNDKNNSNQIIKNQDANRR